MSVSHSQQKHCWENTHAHSWMDAQFFLRTHLAYYLSRTQRPQRIKKQSLFYIIVILAFTAAKARLPWGKATFSCEKLYRELASAQPETDKPAGLAQLFEWIHTQAHKQEAACFSGGLFDSCISSKWGSHANTVAGLSDASSEQLSKLLVSRSQLHAESN